MQAVILAAGESSRFWPLNQKHKSLTKIMGKPLIWYTVMALQKAGVKDIIIVQDKKRQIEKETKTNFSGSKIRYVVQPRPMGMGNAIFLTRHLIKDSFFVLDPYHFLIERLFKEMIKKSKETGAKIVLCGRKTDTPWNYGILKTKGDKALALNEKPKMGKESSNIRVVGIYLLSRDFFQYYIRVRENQYALESALDLYMKDKDVRVVLIKQKTPSLKYPWDLLGLNKILMSHFLKAKINRSARISKRALIGDNVYIGKNVKIFDGAVIRNFCHVGDNCIIGSNALIREYSDLENDVVVGANAEVARSIFQEKTHIHSGFFGDSIIGENCRIGAGVVIANRRLDRENIFSVVKNEKTNTGLTFFGTAIGHHTAVGINAGIMPGVFIGNNSIIGPGTIVFENVPDNTVFYQEFKNIVSKKK